MRSAVVIDDDDDSRLLISTVLQHAGWSVRTAESGQQGLAAVLDALPVAVICDIQMPGMDGVQLIGRLRASEATRNLPIIAVTASVTAHERDLVLEGGADAVIGKPIDTRAFASQVDRIVLSKTSGG